MCVSFVVHSAGLQKMSRCADKMDQYGLWIDSCVGLGKQRSFNIFLVIFTTIIYFYYTVFSHALDIMFAEISDGSFSELPRALTSWSAAPIKHSGARPGMEYIG